MYVVKSYFEDMFDEHHPYYPGDTYPRKGFMVDKKRLAELSGTNNARGKSLIEFKRERKRSRKKQENNHDDDGSVRRA